jgi:lipid-binding SYLF domain-containing protein
LIAHVLALVTCFGLSARAGEKKDLDQEVAEAIAQFKKADPGMTKLFDGAAGYALFPKVAKGGLGLGAARGTGQLFAKGEMLGETSLTQVTVGFQAGGQVYSEVIFFETQKSLDDFKSGNFEFSAQVSAVAAAEGVSKNAKYENGVAVFTLAKGGLMYEASVGGQKFKFKPKK